MLVYGGCFNDESEYCRARSALISELADTTIARNDWLGLRLVLSKKDYDNEEKAKLGN